MNAPSPRRKTVTQLTDPELEELYAALDRAAAAAAAIEAACALHVDEPQIMTPHDRCAADRQQALCEFGAAVRKALDEVARPLSPNTRAGHASSQQTVRGAS